MRKARLRTALIGCGKVGRIHADALAELPESELVAVCDGFPDRAPRIRGGVRSHRVRRRDGDAREGQARGRLHLHAPPAPRGSCRQCARRGRPRPGREAHGRDARRLRPDAGGGKASGATLGVVSQRRWFEPVARVKAAIRAGKIGRPALGVVGMFNWRDASYYASDPWRGRWETEGGGVLVNQAPISSTCSPGSWAKSRRSAGAGRTSTIPPWKSRTRPWPSSASGREGSARS